MTGWQVWWQWLSCTPRRNFRVGRPGRARWRRHVGELGATAKRQEWINVEVARAINRLSCRSAWFSDLEQSLRSIWV